MKKEEWKNVVGYEGIYQISSFGRLKSCRRNGLIMKQTKDRYGYLYVNLFKDGIATKKKVHQLVAIAFIPNVCDYSCVNHKNEKKTDNTVDNLEWCTVEYNNRYGSKVKPIVQCDLNGNTIKAWDSAGEASNFLHIDASAITKCCKHKKSNYKGYKWEYTEPYEEEIRSWRTGEVIQLNPHTLEYICSYKNAYDAFLKTGIKYQSIGDVCKGKRNIAGGFIWKYK